MKKHAYYRLYFQVNNQEYSYVGTSVNVNRRLKEHFSYLSKVLNLQADNNSLASTFYHSVILKQILPTTKALYYKLALFMLKHNLTINDLKFEILYPKEKEFINRNEYLAIERAFIEKYHGYRRGFNGLLANYFHYFLRKIDVSDYVYKDLEIACEIVNTNDLKKYINCFWWSFLTLPMVIRLTSIAIGMKEVAQKPLAKFEAFYTNDSEFIDEQIKFYQDQYQKTKILNQVTF